jgi:DNA-binding MarR family transcriptional regulator
MAGDCDQAGSGCGAGASAEGAASECAASEDAACQGADWALIGAGLTPDEFTQLGPDARRIALIERSARFAIEFGRWKDAARTDGIGYEHMRLLQSLNFYGPAIMREIGDKLLITPRNMTVMVDQLEQAKLVARRAYPADRRATLLELTPAGKQLADSALLPRFRAMGDIFGQFTDEEQCKFYGALGCIIDLMHSGGAC